jgi:hypothetical protein
MSDDARVVKPYEPPSIKERAPIDVPLVAAGSPQDGSAVFRI